ncbi:guanylate kinase [bacterium]|nr:guanylate kinase [bacterium]
MQVNLNNNNYQNNYNPIGFKQIVRNDIPAKVLKDNKYLLLVSGPSGVGKDSIMNQILHKFNKIVTHTTRPKRAGEVEGKSYFFTTVDKFKEGIKNNEFVEYIEGFSGKFYGTKKETIKNALNGEKPALAIVDVDGAKSIKDNLKNDPQINVLSVFFRPPSEEPLKVLEARLNKRGSETAESIQTRLKRAEYEINRAKEYDAEIEVNNVEESLDDMHKLLNLK